MAIRFNLPMKVPMRRDICNVIEICRPPSRPIFQLSTRFSAISGEASFLSLWKKDQKTFSEQSSKRITSGGRASPAWLGTKSEFDREIG
jgi:hypothetical protein